MSASFALPPRDRLVDLIGAACRSDVGRSISNGRSSGYTMESVPIRQPHGTPAVRKGVDGPSAGPGKDQCKRVDRMDGGNRRCAGCKRKLDQGESGTAPCQDAGAKPKIHDDATELQPIDGFEIYATKHKESAGERKPKKQEAGSEHAARI